MAIVSVSPPALAAGNTNNYTGIGSAGFARMTPNVAGSSLTGIVPPSPDVTQIIFLNLGSADLSLIHDSLASDPGNRFMAARDADVVLGPDEMATLIYDSTSLRWRIY